MWRFHAFLTTTNPDVLDPVAADKTHRGHAMIEQANLSTLNERSDWPEVFKAGASFCGDLDASS